VQNRVLVADDDRAIRESLARALELEGYDVATVVDGVEALTRVRRDSFDALVVDVMMPGVDGLAVCRLLRAEGDRTPVLMLTARVETPDRVAGLDAGADDYLPKPFELRELRARLRALLRRTGDPATGRVAFAELRLDRDRHGVWVGAGFVDLSRTELQLLELLMVNAGTVLEHGVIYDRVWGYDFGPGANSLRVYVGYLRRKLAEAGARPLIRTVRGVGYVLREP
jgi:two-component system, OmpR family, response regulator MprA